MIDVIPSINCHDKDFDCVTKKIRVAETFAQWVHVDVSDGSFTFNKSWHEPERWHELGTSLHLEVHLMVEEPEKHIGRWLRAGAKRIIVHVEAIEDERYRRDSVAAMAVFEEMSQECRRAGVELMLAINPETSVRVFDSYLSHCRLFQILAVTPGPAGQPFLPVVLEKVRWLHKQCPDAIIEVDGGIIPATGQACREAGATILIAGSYTLNAEDPKKAYNELKNV